MNWENSMRSMIKLLLVNGLLALLPVLYAAETIFVPDNSLLLKADKDKKNWTVKAVVRQGFSAEVLRKEKVFLQQREDFGRCVDAYHLNIPGAEDLCYFPEVIHKKGKDGKIRPSIGKVDKIDSLMFLGIFFFVLGLAAAASFLQMRSEKKYLLLPAALVLFFWGYAFWYIGFVSDSIITPFDDVHYFNIAKQLLAGDFTSEKYYYTIGFPILCIPLILLFHMRDWVDFLLTYMNFQTFILIPGLFLVLYRFFYVRMGLSRIRSFAILLLWEILIVFYLPMLGTTDPSVQYAAETYYANANFSFIEPRLYFRFFNLTWLGRSAMSDYAAVLLLIVLLYAAMKRSNSLVRFFVLSMGFGFLCLVRINYIFFAPLLAFVFYDSFSGLWKNKWNYLRAFLCGTAGFMIVFVWQFVLNKIQFGSPFIWPYSLHNYAPDRGFVWSIFPYGFKYLCQTNYIYLVLGLSSLFLIPERRTRVLLTLWIFPTLLFFCGYPVIFNNPTRFIFALYPPLLAAVVMNPVWKTEWPVRIKAGLVVFSLCLLGKSNLFFDHFQPWGLDKFGVTNTAFIVIQCVIFLFCCGVIFSMHREIKADRPETVRYFRFLILFTAVFFFGSLCPYIVGILVLAALVYGLRDTVQFITAPGESDRLTERMDP